MGVIAAAVGGLAAAAAVAIWRKRVTGAAAGGRLLLVSIAILVALVVGTALDVSGVALAVPVLGGMALEVWRSRWRLGDIALFSWMGVAGTALGYRLAATLDPHTGSYADQGVLALAVLAVLSSMIAVVSGWRRRRRR